MNAIRSRPRATRRARVILLAALVAAAALAAGATMTPLPALAGLAGVGPGAVNGTHVVISWNDLGMHCMNLLFKAFAVLPPYNNLAAQVIQRDTYPKVVTTTVTVNYAIRGNTYSVGKTDFWTYAPQLFGVNLPDNVGLKGKMLADSMDPLSDHFFAEGVPLTPFLDSAPRTLYPYQLVDVAAKDLNGNVLARTTTVAPVSTEMLCVTCHGDPAKSSDVYVRILTLHDKNEGTSLLKQQPVLCANCHADNALGLPGVPGVENMSRAMHNRHTNVKFVTKPICYNCHPGPMTKCLRDVMYQEGKTCTDCHGGMAQVADPSRNPWIDEPKCGTCHGSQFAENPGKRYRDSVGHGGLYCEACHGSPHAIVPTVQRNDNIQNYKLQGHAGTLDTCTVCHTTVPPGPGPHQ